MFLFVGPMPTKKTPEMMRIIIAERGSDIPTIGAITPMLESNWINPTVR
jgi:hypothetical protein